MCLVKYFIIPLCHCLEHKTCSPHASASSSSDTLFLLSQLNHFPATALLHLPQSFGFTRRPFFPIPPQPLLLLLQCKPLFERPLSLPFTTQAFLLLHPPFSPQSSFPLTAQVPQNPNSSFPLTYQILSDFSLTFLFLLPSTQTLTLSHLTLNLLILCQPLFLALAPLSPPPFNAFALASILSILLLSPLQSSPLCIHLTPHPPNNLVSSCSLDHHHPQSSNHSICPFNNNTFSFHTFPILFQTYYVYILLALCKLRSPAKLLLAIHGYLYRYMQVNFQNV